MSLFKNKSSLDNKAAMYLHDRSMMLTNFHRLHNTVRGYRYTQCYSRYCRRLGIKLIKRTL